MSYKSRQDELVQEGLVRVLWNLKLCGFFFRINNGSLHILEK